MLESYKSTYEELAYSLIPDWKDIDKNELINSYIKHEHTNPKLAQSYLGAIFCKYWHYISTFYSKSCNSKVTPEECYNWLVDGILLGLNYRAWLNPNNKLYGDPNGPDKAMNVCITTYRQAFYQYSNYACRKLNYESINIEDILAKIDAYNDSKEDLKSSFFSNICSNNIDNKELNYMETPLKNFIISSFNKGNYFLSFMVDNICNYSDVFKTLEVAPNKKTKRFSKKKLCFYMNRLNERYAKNFSNTYNININMVNRAIRENINNLNTESISKNIDINLEYLRNNLKESDLC